jgi:hypothetical protein
MVAKAKRKIRSKTARAEGIRILQTDGTAVSASGGEVSPKGGRKSVLWHSPMKLEAPTIPKGIVGVVHCLVFSR